MPTHQRLWTDDGEDVQDRREPSVELDEKPTVGVRQPGPTFHLAPQNNQLLPERCILRLKSALRLEWRSQDAQHKEDQRYHAARIADSLTPPIRMGFSAHTHKSEALFPEREPLETLEEIRREIGPYAFGSQYQQNPVPPDGATIRWEWFGVYDERPSRSELLLVVQSWDTAHSPEPTADFFRLHHLGPEQSRTVVSSRSMSPADRLSNLAASGAGTQENLGSWSRRDRESGRRVRPPWRSQEGVHWHACSVRQVNQAKESVRRGREKKNDKPPLATPRRGNGRTPKISKGDSGIRTSTLPPMTPLGWHVAFPANDNGQAVHDPQEHQTGKDDVRIPQGRLERGAFSAERSVEKRPEDQNCGEKTATKTTSMTKAWSNESIPSACRPPPSARGIAEEMPPPTALRTSSASASQQGTPLPYRRARPFRGGTATRSRPGPCSPVPASPRCSARRAGKELRRWGRGGKADVASRLPRRRSVTGLQFPPLRLLSKSDSPTLFEDHQRPGKSRMFKCYPSTTGSLQGGCRVRSYSIAARNGLTLACCGTRLKW